MSMISNTEALLAELYTTAGKAEIVGGEIVMRSPTGDAPSSAGGETFVALRAYAKKQGGRAYTDNAAFLVDQAEAEPAVPGWTMSVDSLFD